MIRLVVQVLVRSRGFLLLPLVAKPGGYWIRYLGPDLNHTRPLSPSYEAWIRCSLRQVSLNKEAHGRQRRFLNALLDGIGPVLALIILAEAGDPRRFDHHRQFLKFCGLDLGESRSGASRGREKLSKRGNARLRYAFWMAGGVAVRMRENSFREKYQRYIRADSTDPDLKRKALTAVMAKMARVAYAVVKTLTAYQTYFEAAVPSGSIPLRRAVEAVRTS